MSRIFDFDVFISHRRGDGAGALERELATRGCKAWFDGDSTITERQLATAVSEKCAQSRSVVAWLKADFAISPWTLLEIAYALRSESTFGIRRLLVFLPDGQPPRADPALPEDVQAAVRDDTRVLTRDFSRLARDLRVLNTGWPCRRSSRRGAANEISRALSAYRANDSTATAPTPDLVAPPDLAAVRLQVAEQLIVEWPPTADCLPDRPARALSLLSELERSEYGGINRTPAARQILRAIARLAFSSTSSDDRANALLILRELAACHDRLAARRLASYLQTETDWDVANVCYEPNEPWWPAVLRGVSWDAFRRFKERGTCHLPSAVVPYVDPVIRAAISSLHHKLFKSEDLPPVYQVAAALHRMQLLVSAAPGSNDLIIRTPNVAIAAGAGVSELEVACRELHPALVLLLRSDARPTGVLCQTLDTMEALVVASEAHGGAPLVSIAEYFVDHFLRPMCMLILMLDDPRRPASVTRRAIALLECNVPARESRAYLAAVEDCEAWRSSNPAGLSDGSPIRLSKYRSGLLKNRSPNFRRLWLLP